MREGLLSLRNVKNKFLSWLYTITDMALLFPTFLYGILLYKFSEGVGILVALVLFVVGTFAFITMMILYMVPVSLMSVPLSF